VAVCEQELLQHILVTANRASNFNATSQNHERWNLRGVESSLQQGKFIDVDNEKRSRRKCVGPSNEERFNENTLSAPCSREHDNCRIRRCNNILESGLCRNRERSPQFLMLQYLRQSSQVHSAPHVLRDELEQQRNIEHRTVNYTLGRCDKAARQGHGRQRQK